MKKILLLIVVCLLPIFLFGDGLRFDGVNDWVNFTDVIGSAYNLADGPNAVFTIDLWFNPHDMNDDLAGGILGDDIVGDKDAIISINDLADDDWANHLLLFIWNNELVLHIGEGNGGNVSLTSFGSNSYNKWYHLTLIYYNATNRVHVYLDGIQVGNEVSQFNTLFSYVLAGTLGNLRMSIGQEYDYVGTTLTPGDFYEGGIDEIRVWNRALDPTEITNLANDNPSEAIGQLNPPSVRDYVARFNMEDGTATTITSSIGSGSIGYLMDGTSQAQGPMRFPHSDVSLPIELSSFTAKSVNGSVELKWVTESEINNAGFNVYRSDDDANYEKLNISLLEGAVNSSTPNAYTFTDVEVKVNAKYYYKLEDVSTSGETSLHGPVSVITTEKEAAATKFALGTAYPNPFNPSTTINFSLAEEAKVQINIYDMAGNLVNTLTNSDYATGNYNVVWNAVDFNSNPVSAGIYIYQMTTNTGFSQSAKMILIK